MALRAKSNVVHVVENESHEIRDKSENHNGDRPSHETLKYFTENTSLHGAKYLFARGILRRLFWSVCLALSLSYCIVQFHRTMAAFHSRPFNTKITTANEVDVFPAVTVCNMNLMSKRRYINWVKMSMNLTDDVIMKKVEDIEELLKRVNISGTEAKDRSPELFVRPINMTRVQLEAHQIQLGHTIEEMLLPTNEAFKSCSINGVPCGPDNFTSFLFSSFGLCYTFNSGQNGSEPIGINLASRNSGLRLWLNVERESYVRTLTRPFVGLMFLVHDQKSFPFVEEFGIAIQPGVHTVCAIKPKKFKNLGYPYSTNCSDKKLTMFDGTDYVYSKQACLMQCLNEFYVKKCGCRSSPFKANAPVCSPIDTTLCVFPQREQFGSSPEKLQCEEHCPQPCGGTEFESSFSYSGLQTDALTEHLVTFVNGTNVSSYHRTLYRPLLNMTQSEREKYIEDNIVSLDIYFNDLSYEKLEQTPLFYPWDLIGILGGNFGLFLGMSILTLLEFVDFVVVRIFHFICRRR